MTINDRLAEYAGLPTFDFDEVTDTGALPAADAVAWRIRVDEDGEDRRWGEVFAEFLARVDTAKVTALLIGHWGYTEYQDGYYAPDVLAGHADRFPALRSVFVGDITMEEMEVSWIQHGDLNTLLAAFPALERLDVRGSEGLKPAPFSAPRLRTLRFETGGLPSTVVHAVTASDLPNLEHLDLWIGTPAYEGDVSVNDLAPILSGERFPSLRHLGLENAEAQNLIAAAVAGAPVVARLESLSLALGMLDDEGAEALLSGQPLTHLRRLDLHHHFLTDAMQERVRAALPGVEVDLSGANTSRRNRRYIAVSE